MLGNNDPMFRIDFPLFNIRVSNYKVSLEFIYLLCFVEGIYLKKVRIERINEFRFEITFEVVLETFLKTKLSMTFYMYI